MSKSSSTSRGCCLTEYKVTHFKSEKVDFYHEYLTIKFFFLLDESHEAIELYAYLLFDMPLRGRRGVAMWLLSTLNVNLKMFSGEGRASLLSRFRVLLGINCTENQGSIH